LLELENGLCRIVTGRYNLFGLVCSFPEGAPFWKDYPFLIYFLVSFMQSGRNTTGKGLPLDQLLVRATLLAGPTFLPEVHTEGSPS